MKIRITESQKVKLLYELSPKSTGVKEFIEHVKQTPGLLKFLGFRSFKALEEFILDSDYKEFNDLKKEANGFEIKK